MPPCVACIYKHVHASCMYFPSGVFLVACGLILVTSLRCVEVHPYSAHGMNFMLPNVLCMYHKLVMGRVSVEQGHYPVSTSQTCVTWNKCIMCALCARIDLVSIPCAYSVWNLRRRCMEQVIISCAHITKLMVCEERVHCIM